MLNKEETKLLIQILHSNQEFRVKNALKYETEQKYSWLEVQEEILKAYELVLKIFEK